MADLNVRKMSKHIIKLNLQMIFNEIVVHSCHRKICNSINPVIFHLPQVHEIFQQFVQLE